MPRSRTRSKSPPGHRGKSKSERGGGGDRWSSAGRGGGGGGGRGRRSRSPIESGARGRVSPSTKTMRADEESTRLRRPVTSRTATSSRKRSPSSPRRGRDYASPSPPAASAVASARKKGPPGAASATSSLRVTARDSGRRSITETTVATAGRGDEDDDQQPKYPAEGSRTRGGSGALIFKGAEFGRIDSKEQKKIQIDIRRSIPVHRVSESPIRRAVEDPSRIVLTRRQDEGVKTIFDREEIRLWISPDPEERVINLVKQHDSRHPTAQDRIGKRAASRSRSPRDVRQQQAASSAGSASTDLRSRLSTDDRYGGRQQQQQRPTRHDEAASARRPTVRDRLGPTMEVEGATFLHEDRGRRMNDEERMLDREELESQRPTTKPWDINPEFVPKGTYYFEHDNRETFEEDNNRFSNNSDRRNVDQRGRSNGDGRGGGGGYFGRERGNGVGGGYYHRRGYRGGFSGGQSDYSYRGRGGGRGRGYEGGGGYGGTPWRGGRGYAGRGGYRQRERSPQWKHDLFEEQEEPSSTTNE